MDLRILFVHLGATYNHFSEGSENYVKKSGTERVTTGHTSAMVPFCLILSRDLSSFLSKYSDTLQISISLL